MKKYLLSLIALGVLSSAAFAEIDRPRMKRPDSMLDRIEAILGDENNGLSERKIAYLEQRRDLLDIQLRMRVALREALGTLGKDATDQERREVVQGVRDQFAEDLEGIKQARREAMRLRRANRDSEEG
jgi:hypothetical protein